MLHPDFRRRRRGSPSMGEVGGERVRLGLGTGESEAVRVRVRYSTGVGDINTGTA